MKHKLTGWLTGFRALITAAVLLGTGLSVALMMIAFYSRFTEAIEQTSLASNLQIGSQVGASLENYFENMLSIAQLVSEDMGNGGRNIDQTLRLATDLRNDVEAVVVLDWEGRPLQVVDGLPLKEDVNIYRQDWCDVQKLYQNGYVFSMPHVQNLFRGKYEWVVSLVILTKWTGEDDKVHYGSVLVDLNFNSFDDICSRASHDSDGFVYITDRMGNIVYHPAQQLLYLGLQDEDTGKLIGKPDGGDIGDYNGRRCAYSVSTLNYSGWRVVRVDYLKSALDFDANLRRDLVRILLLIILAVLALAFVISSLTSRPIRRLTGIVREVRLREFEENPVDLSAFRFPWETKQLAGAFGEMLGRIHRLMAQIQEEQKQLRKSEIKALQAQINPHFLYNTLDSIVWMAECGENKGVTVMTTALADFFRMSISDARDYITVEEELAYARNYLIIQEFRYQNRFDYEILAEPEALPLKVTKIILQPLIENAIYHGIERLPDKGNITVRAGLRDGRLLLEVEDNGCGMDRETLANILESKPDKKSGIGVKNVHQRIQMLFGQEYGLEFESALEEGTTVRVWLPIVKGGEEL